MIDSKDLQQFKASELGGEKYNELVKSPHGIIFYVQDEKDKTKFYTCAITEYELKWHPTSVKEKTKMLSRQGRLFRRINKPWQSFVN